MKCPDAFDPDLSAEGGERIRHSVTRKPNATRLKSHLGAEEKVTEVILRAMAQWSAPEVAEATAFRRGSWCSGPLSADAANGRHACNTFAKSLAETMLTGRDSPTPF